MNDTGGSPITDPLGNCGFPGFDGMLAKNTLGYVAAMQESGVPVTYGYISDAHDFHVPTLATDAYASSATGPGELAHEQQLHDYDTAFGQFFDNHQGARHHAAEHAVRDHRGRGRPLLGRARHRAARRHLADLAYPRDVHEPQHRARRTRSARSTPTSTASSRPASRRSTSTPTTPRRSTSTASRRGPTRRCASSSRTSAA